MLSIIIPVYNEAENLRLLHHKLIQALDNLGREYELIYVDDSSTDDSNKFLQEFEASNSKVKVIRLARNFGQTLAIQAGIDYSHGDIFILMDADLQNDPGDIPKLLQKIDEGYDVVSGWRKQRRDPLFSKKLPSFIGNKLISFLFGVRIHDLGCTLKAYRRNIIANIRLYGEMHRLLPLYAAMNGASITEVEVSHNPRLTGKTHYGWERIFKVSLDLITVRFFEKYSTKPIYFFGSVGVGMLMLGAMVGIAVIIRTVFFQGAWISPLLFISLMFFAMGVQLILMGLLAEIIIRIYYQSQKTQTYLIKETKNNKINH
ncbi:MAG: glycosyltransferase family 2 protein [Candidatus Omnitrophica bacterium]|nr:glycosyltransferase family 2 protein [Candidatus Omnitrophota bacterium]